jgi:hypothetical protein
MLTNTLTLLVGLSLGLGMAWPLVRRPGLEPTNAAWEGFLREFERARRYERPFVVAVVPDAASMPGLRVTDNRGRPPALQLRRTDETWWVGADLYILLPETTGADGHRWRRRVLAAGACGNLRLAGFPDDGVTTNALLAAVDAAAPSDSLDSSPPNHDDPSRIP